MHNVQQLHSLWIINNYLAIGFLVFSDHIHVHVFMFVAEKESWFWGTVSYIYILMKYEVIFSLE